MTENEIIKVVQAFIDGEQIQYFLKHECGSGKWEDVIGTPLWNFILYDYRIKPKLPETITVHRWACLSKDGFFVFITERYYRGKDTIAAELDIEEARIVGPVHEYSIKVKNNVHRNVFYPRDKIKE